MMSLNVLLQPRRLLLAFFLALLLLLLVLGLVAAGRPVAQQNAQPDWRFGVIESYENPAEAAALGVAWTRVRFHWGDSQPNGPQEWLPPVGDEQIAAEIEAGREVTGLLIGLPAWARDEDGLPRGLWLAADDPGNLWANYVREVVARYRGRINHWVIWNEPDIWDKEAPGHTWDGSLEDFLQLQRTAYLVAKEANPAAIIHLAAFTYFWDANYGREQYFERLLDALMDDPEAAGHNYYFDIATAHLYFQPNQIYDVLVAFQEMMAAHGLQKPIWLMETNAPPIDDPAWLVDSPTLLVHQVEQAAFMPQVLAVSLAAGAERIGVFKLQDTESDRVANPEPFGLLRMDGSRRPAFDTYRLALQYFSGVQQAERERWNEVGQIRLDQGDYTTTVLFSRLPFPQQAEVPATAGEGVLVNMWGEQQRVTADNGVFRVDLPPALCTQPIGDYCMIGSETFYLVQATAGGQLPDALPAVRQSPAGQPIPTATIAAPPTLESLPATAMATVAPLVPTATPLPVPAGLVQSDEALVDFPQSVTFRLGLSPGHDITSAVLNYDVAQRSCVAVDTSAPADLTAEGAEWTWPMVRSGNPPPGAVLSWYWRLTDTAGNEYTTPRQSLTFTDNRFPWRTVEAKGVTLHWYEGEEVGPLLLEAAVAGLRELEQEMGLTLDSPVQLFIYGDAAEMRQAVLYVQDWAGGVAFTPYNTILMGVPPNIADDWGRRTVRHELAHLVVEQFAWSCVGGRRPTWLNEGLAMVAEGSPENVQADIERGIEENAFVPLRSLNGAFPAHDSGASMAYSQSHSVVTFLLEEYGREAMQQLLRLLAEGAGYDEALEQVYGLNTDGIEVAWRESIGAPARQILPTATAVLAESIPTVVPLQGPQDVPTPAATAVRPAGEQGGVLVCGLGALPLLAWAGWYRYRPKSRRKSPNNPDEGGRSP